MASKKKEVISRLLIERAPWDSTDQAFAKLIPFDDPAEHEDSFCREVNAGTMEALRINFDGKPVGIICLQVDESRLRELVIAGVFCDSPEGPLSREIQAACVIAAQARRCVSMRFHTMRAAAARIAADEYGWRLTEVIMRKDVPAVNDQDAPATDASQ